MDDGLRLAQYTERHESIARETILEANQYDVGLGEANMEHVQTNITVSSTPLFFTQIILRLTVHAIVI